MEKLNLTDMLRYFLVGLVVLGVASICRSDDTRNVCDFLGKIGTPFATFAVGTLFFLLYRSLLYDCFLFILVDKLYKGNVRNLLMDRYLIKSRREADELWKILRLYVSKKKMSLLDPWSAGNHLLYMTSLVAAIGELHQLIFCGSLKSQVFLIACALFFLAGAVVSDYRIERMVTLLFRCMDKTEVDRIAGKFGYTALPQEGSG